MKNYMYVITLLCLFFIYSPAHALNNTWETAYDFGNGGTIPDMLTYGQPGTADDKKEAYYKITLSAPGNITINSTNPTNVTNGFWTVYVYDATGINTLLYFTFNSETTKQIGLPSGTYYILISTGNLYDVPFGLTVTNSSGGGYEQELNDDVPISNPIQTGTTYTAAIQKRTLSSHDFDFFSFEALEHSNITLTCNPVSPVADPNQYWEVELYDSNNRMIFRNSFTNIMTSQIGISKGVYYVKVTTYNSWLNDVPYQIKITSVVGNYYEKEYNDTRDTATSISLGDTYSGITQSRLGYSSLDDKDYYYFELPSETAVTVSLRSQNTSSYSSLDAYLIDINGNIMDSFSFTNNATKQYRLAAGKYYVRISCYSNALYNLVPYYLTVAPDISGNSGQVSLLDRFTDGILSFWADPVDTATGAHVMTRNLLQLSGAQPLAFSISYNSLLRSAGPLGNGFNHNYETNLAPQQDGSVRINWNANRRNSFTSKDSLNFTSNESAARFDKLTKNGDGSYSLKRKDSSLYRFDATGRLTTITNRFAQNINLSYDANGRLDKVTEPVSAKYLAFAYDAGGLVASVGDSANRSVSFGRDVSNNITSITDAEGRVVRYTYTAAGLLESGLNSDNSLIFKNTYDTKGRVINQDDGETNTQFTAFEYDETTQPGKLITTITNREANQRIYVHNVNYQLVSLFDEMNDRTDYEYDAQGNMTSVSDANANKTTMVYDVRGNLKETADPQQRKTVMTYDASDNLLTVINPAQITVVTNTYYPNNRLWTSTNAMQDETITYIYTPAGLLGSFQDPKKNTTNFSYTNGLLSRIDAPGGMVTLYEYDLAGRQSKITEASGKVTRFEYDAADNLKKIIEPLNRVTSFTYDEHNNRITSTDANGVTTKYYYNGNNMLVRMEQKPDANTNYTTTYEYAGEDRLSKMIDARGNSTSFFYDKKGRLNYSVDAEGNKSSTKYDAAGNVTQKLDGYDKAVLTNSYDPKTYKLLSIQDASSNTIAYSYADTRIDRVTSILAPEGRRSDFSYDNLNRLAGVLAANPSGGDSISSQIFDENGNRTALIDPNNNRTTFNFDAANRMTSIISQAGISKGFAYNSGKLSSNTNGRSQITTYSYYDDGRIKNITDHAGTITFTYDNNGNILTVTENGKVLRYIYDGLGRVIQYTDGDNNVMAYQYDQVGNLIKLTYPGGKIVQYDYYRNNKLKMVTDWASRVTTYTYDNNGRLLTTSRPDGSVETRTYEANGSGRLAQLKGVKADGTTVINQYDFTYSAGGNVTQEAATGGDIDIAATDANMTYGADNRLSTYNGTTISYDADGNMTSGPIMGSMQALTYDSRNRLLSAGGITYTYDSNNNRIAAETTDQTFKYVVNPIAPLSQILMEKNGSGTVIAYYVYGLGLIGRQDAAGSSYKIYHYDRRGSTIALTDTTGNITDTYTYTVYGERFSHAIGTTTQPFQYNGRDGVVTDSNGFYNMRARYYSPTIKRFVNMDVLMGGVEDGQTINRYIYVNGNPLTLIDPSGLASLMDAWYVLDGGLDFAGGFVKTSTEVPGALIAGQPVLAASLLAAGVTDMSDGGAKLGAAFTNVTAAPLVRLIGRTTGNAKLANVKDADPDDANLLRDNLGENSYIYNGMKYNQTIQSVRSFYKDAPKALRSIYGGIDKLKEGYNELKHAGNLKRAFYINKHLRKSDYLGQKGIESILKGSFDGFDAIRGMFNTFLEVGNQSINSYYLK